MEFVVIRDSSLDSYWRLGKVRSCVNRSVRPSFTHELKLWIVINDSACLESPISLCRRKFGPQRREQLVDTWSRPLVNSDRSPTCCNPPVSSVSNEKCTPSDVNRTSIEMCISRGKLLALKKQSPCDCRSMPLWLKCVLHFIVMGVLRAIRRHSKYTTAIARGRNTIQVGRNMTSSSGFLWGSISALLKIPLICFTFTPPVGQACISTRQSFRPFRVEVFQRRFNRTPASSELPRGFRSGLSNCG